jgi:hypothetical protein
MQSTSFWHLAKPISLTQSVSTQVNLRAGARGARPATTRERKLIMQRACSVAYYTKAHTPPR